MKEPTRHMNSRSPIPVRLPPISRRVVSMASTSTIPLAHHSQSMVDKSELYKYVLKIVLLEYSNEARFRTPILDSLIASSGSFNNSGSGGSSSIPRRINNTNGNAGNRSSMVFDQKLPSYAFKNLRVQLNLIMTNQKIVDEKFRRSLLRLYGELLNQDIENELRNIDFLISKFTAFASQELRKVSEFENDDALNKTVFKQTRSFIDLLIELIKNKKDFDSGLISQLNQRKDSFQDKSNSKLIQPEQNQNVKYPTKSYRISDMNKSAIELIKKIFGVDDTQLQQDVFKYKDISLAKPAHNDAKELIKVPISIDNNFVSDVALNQWKERQQNMTNQVINRYKIPADLTLLPLPPLPQGEDFFIIPRNGEARSYFMSLVKLVISLKNQLDFSDPGKPILEKSESDMLNIIARVWHIDYPTRAVSFYSAVQEVNGLVDFPIESDSSKKGSSNLTPVNIPASEKLFHTCKRIVEDDGGLDWDEKQYTWSLEDQQEWIDNLSDTYSQTFVGLRENIQLIFNKTVKPKFGPYLQFLGDYVESDSLFPALVESDLPKKWEKRLKKTLTRVAGSRYEEYLFTIPRDDSINVIHMINVCEALVKDIRDLQKRYKNPLLGFLNVSRSVAAITTGMFASDAQKTIQYIQLVTNNRNERIPYSDALEVYQLLSEIRDIYNQVTPSGSKFNFNLEKFFFPYLKSWVEESDEKIHLIVSEAFKKDDYAPINLDEDQKRNSNAVLDIFSIIKQYLNALKKQNWGDEYQLVTVYTTLLKSISNGAIFYSDEITTKIIKELEPKVEEKEKEELSNQEEKKNWFDGVKNVVSNIQNFKRPEPEVVYNFEPQTCIALNNISSMMHNLTKLEDWLDPESISDSLATYNPNSRTQYLSHVFSLRVVRGENLRAYKDSTSGKINPYVAIRDLDTKKLVGKTRMIEHSPDPYWDEEFEITIPANSSLNTYVTVWDGRFGQHCICGKAPLELNPRKFKHNGIPEEIVLDLDLQGKIIIEVAVESETLDAMFVMGRAYRSLKRAQERSIKLIVEKFSGFISNCFSKQNLKAVCAKGSNPSREEFEASIENLCDYLNMNLSILKEFLMDENFMKVMVETWKHVINSADELMLPNLSKAKIKAEGGSLSLTSSSSSSSSSHYTNTSSWQSMTSKFSNVSLASIGISGMDGPLSIVEIETILQWLNFLCSFFHNEGNGPPMEDLKTDKYQSLLLVPALYDQSDDYLIEEVNNLSSAYVQMLNNRNNIDSYVTPPSSSNARNINNSRSINRAGSLLRNKTINANATAKLRKQAAKEVQESRSDPISSKTLKEDIILRILISRGRKDFVCQRLNQRAKIAYSMATERMVRAVAEKKFTS